MNQAELTTRAFQIADESMFALMECSCLSNEESKTLFSLCDDNSNEVGSIAETSEALQEAIEWLTARGYIEVVEDDTGGNILVVKRPE